MNEKIRAAGNILKTIGIDGADVLRAARNIRIVTGAVYATMEGVEYATDARPFTSSIARVMLRLIGGDRQAKWDMYCEACGYPMSAYTAPAFRRADFLPASKEYIDDANPIGAAGPG